MGFQLVANSVTLNDYERPYITTLPCIAFIPRGLQCRTEWIQTHCLLSAAEI